MLKKILFIAGLSVAISSTAQQIRVKGHLVDDKTAEPVSFAAIGIVGTNVGTISMEDGSFDLNVQEEFANDSITFSALSHYPKKINIRDFLGKEKVTIRLTERVTQLGEVQIGTKKVRKKYEMFGVQKIPFINWTACFADKFRRGAQIAHLIEAKNYPIVLSKARIHLRFNNLDTAKVRVRVFSLEKKTGLPGEDLLFESIIQEISGKKSWVEIDLEDHYLAIESDFFVSIEFLDLSFDPDTRLMISCFPPREFPEKQFVRMTSLGKWKYLPIQKMIYAVGAEVFWYK